MRDCTKGYISIHRAVLNSRLYLEISYHIVHYKLLTSIHVFDKGKCCVCNCFIVIFMLFDTTLKKTNKCNEDGQFFIQNTL